MSRRVDLKSVGKRFGETVALDSIDLALEPGSFTAVVGPSGCGKSTLLRMIGGLDTPTSGTISIDTQSPEAARRAKEYGWMAQAPALLPWRTVLQNVTLAQTLGVPRKRQEGGSRPDPFALLELVGLAGSADTYPGTLSGGMQQRVSLARTLAVGAPVWLMDEPFSALDELTRESLADDLIRLWSDFQPTVVWVTHHIPEAVRLADRLVLLTPSPGRIAGVIEVDLPRPRAETSHTVQRTVSQARSVLRLSGTPIEVAQ